MRFGFFIKKPLCKTGQDFILTVGQSSTRHGSGQPFCWPLGTGKHPSELRLLTDQSASKKTQSREAVTEKQRLDHQGAYTDRVNSSDKYWIAKRGGYKGLQPRVLSHDFSGALDTAHVGQAHIKNRQLGVRGTKGAESSPASREGSTEAKLIGSLYYFVQNGAEVWVRTDNSDGDCPRGHSLSTGLSFRPVRRF
jgi:hypothetical protein